MFKSEDEGYQVNFYLESKVYGNCKYVLTCGRTTQQHANRFEDQHIAVSRCESVETTDVNDHFWRCSAKRSCDKAEDDCITHKHNVGRAEDDRQREKAEQEKAHAVNSDDVDGGMGGQ